MIITIKREEFHAYFNWLFYDEYYEAGAILQRVSGKKIVLQMNDFCCFFDFRKFDNLVSNKQIWLMQSK
jgi:hypothetical protein